MSTGCIRNSLYRGYRFFGRHQYQSAIRQFTYYLDRAEGDEAEYVAAGYFYRGLSWSALKKSDIAADNYRQAFSLVPYFFGASFNLGVENLRLGKFPESETCFKSSWQSMISAYRGELDKSLLWNRKTFKHDMESCYMYYGMVLVGLGKHDELKTLIATRKDIGIDNVAMDKADRLFNDALFGKISDEQAREFFLRWVKTARLFWK